MPTESWKGDTVLCVKGFGLANVQLNVPASADTVYRIGSVTKQFTAAAILVLVEDGKIALDDPLTKFLPDYPKSGYAIAVLANSENANASRISDRIARRLLEGNSN